MCSRQQATTYIEYCHFQCDYLQRISIFSNDFHLVWYKVRSLNQSLSYNKYKTKLLNYLILTLHIITN